mmetsp:Transcript_36567/g.115024  ORF Transcript_36567/g.115024 Transcript_36567/m.115024 type:complete len:233 (+) Transcript_36567:80-778(+)
MDPPARSLLPHCLLSLGMECEVPALASVGHQLGLEPLQEAIGERADSGLVRAVNNHDVALLVETDCAVRVPLAVLLQIGDLGTHAQPGLQMREGWLEVCLHATALQYDLHGEAARSLLDVVVDASCLCRPCARGPNCDKVTTSSRAAHVVVAQRVPLAISVVVLSTEPTRNPWVLPEGKLVRLGVIWWPRQVYHLRIDLRRPAADEPLPAKTASHLLLGGLQLADVRRELRG